ncbi:MAG: alpha/beta fold hydrolase, partial [Promethearchaeota archaeon]
YVLFFRTNKAEDALSANNYANLLGVITTPEMEFTEDDKQMYINAWSQPGALTGGLNYYRAGGLRPPSQGEKIDELSNEQIELNPVMIKMPTLVIWGEKDNALTTHNLVGLDEFVPDLTIKRIPDGSHWVINEEPSKVNRLIREFI